MAVLSGVNLHFTVIFAGVGARKVGRCNCSSSKRRHLSERRGSHTQSRPAYYRHHHHIIMDHISDWMDHVLTRLRDGL